MYSHSGGGIIYKLGGLILYTEVRVFQDIGGSFFSFTIIDFHLFSSIYFSNVEENALISILLQLLLMNHWRIAYGHRILVVSGLNLISS